MIELPSEVRTVEKNQPPRDLVIVGLPKIGKGTILGALTKEKNALVLDLEKGGYEFIDARVVSVYGENDDRIDAYQNYLEVRKALLAEKGKYDYLIIDVLSELDAFSEIGGTYYYMYQTTMGKNFNRRKDNSVIDIRDPEFRMVTTLGDGAGFQWSRKFFLDQIEFFTQISPYRIYAAHVADKFIKSGNEEVSAPEISLTGKLKQIFASKVTSLCKLVSDGNKRYLNFDVMNESIIAGSRAPHLSGQILISEKIDGEVKTYWDKIYK